MTITHVLVILDDQESEDSVNDMINGLQKIGEFSGASLVVTTTVQSAINILAVGCDDVSFSGKLNG